MAEIKLTNGVKIASESTALHGIDTLNCLATFEPGSEVTQMIYTATQDCWVRSVSGASNGTNQHVQIDGVQSTLFGNYTGFHVTTFPLRKGQSARVAGTTRYNWSIKVFGVK